MVEQISHRRSYDPDLDAYDENTAGQRAVPYRFGHSARTDSYPDESVPLFLSDYDGEPDPNAPKPVPNMGVMTFNWSKPKPDQVA